mgnify:CR=1 FL=1
MGVQLSLIPPSLPLLSGHSIRLRLSYKLGTLSKSWFRLAVIMIVILGISSSTTFAVWLSNIHSSSGQNAPQWILTGVGRSPVSLSPSL